jgi:hypothetical protein
VRVHPYRRPPAPAAPAALEKVELRVTSRDFDPKLQDVAAAPKCAPTIITLTFPDCRYGSCLQRPASHSRRSLMRIGRLSRDARDVHLKQHILQIVKGTHVNEHYGNPFISLNKKLRGSFKVFKRAAEHQRIYRALANPDATGQDHCEMRVCRYTNPADALKQTVSRLQTWAIQWSSRTTLLPHLSPRHVPQISSMDSLRQKTPASPARWRKPGWSLWAKPIWMSLAWDHTQYTPLMVRSETAREQNGTNGRMSSCLSAEVLAEAH